MIDPVDDKITSHPVGGNDIDDQAARPDPFEDRERSLFNPAIDSPHIPGEEPRPADAMADSGPVLRGEQPPDVLIDQDSHEAYDEGQ